jgi:hypothetical protein
LAAWASSPPTSSAPAHRRISASICLLVIRVLLPLLAKCQLKGRSKVVHYIPRVGLSTTIVEMPTKNGAISPGQESCIVVDIGAIIDEELDQIYVANCCRYM